jgi:uncharacterized protein YjbI with pentapeptide repeats
MADEAHIAKLHEGVEAWNRWRKENPTVIPDLAGADLEGLILVDFDLSKANLKEAMLCGADLFDARLGEADLSGAHLNGADLNRCYLLGAKLPGADLTGAQLIEADLFQANLVGANLKNANLMMADLMMANLTEADLKGANLERGRLVETNITGAILTDCAVYGMSAWNLLGEPKEQLNLLVSRTYEPHNEPSITVDDLEMAQFMYMLIRYEKLRKVIDVVTSKVVLILGRFGKRLSILNALQEQLRNYVDEEGKARYIPVVFDFEGPKSQDLMTTVRTIAHLSRFIIVDLTAPKSAAVEVHDIVPQLKTAVKLIIDVSSGEQPPKVLESDLKYDWLIPEVYGYGSVEELCANLESYVISPAEEKRQELKRAEAKFIIETS